MCLGAELGRAAGPRADMDATVPMLWLDDLASWDGALPAVLVRIDCTREMRHALLNEMAARALGRPADAVAILHRPGRGPIVTSADPVDIAPALRVSLASRGRISAVAAAFRPIGIDVEMVDVAGEVPWGVLHPNERAFLARLSGSECAAAFARLWTLKEAYLKARRWGLAHDPASFEVSFVDESHARIRDPGEGRQVLDAVTVWRAVDGGSAALSAVLLGSEPAR
jgi:4'-phosphopantetheinyl transferase